jgi:hypothetical protein
MHSCVLLCLLQNTVSLSVPHKTANQRWYARKALSYCAYLKARCVLQFPRWLFLQGKEIVLKKLRNYIKLKNFLFRILSLIIALHIERSLA